MNISWTIIGILIFLAILVAIALHKAPFGYQDETGFHYGQKNERLTR